MRHAFEARAFRRFIAIFALAALAAVAPIARAGSIFDDDYTPPAQPAVGVPPAMPPTIPPPNPATDHAPNPPTPPETPTPTPGPEASILPAPSAVDQARSRKSLKEAYSADLKDNSATGRLLLANKLLADAEKVTDNPSDRFVLLVGACNAAAEGGDYRLAFNAAKTAASAYKIDAAHLSATAFLKAPARNLSPTQATDAAIVGLGAVGSLSQSSDFDTASGLLAALQPLVFRAKSPALTAQYQDLVQTVRVRRAAFEQYTVAKRKLTQTPDDAEANSVVGRYLWLQAGNLTGAIPYLVRGKDRDLKDLAAGDQAANADPLSRGDAWWQYSTTQSGTVKIAAERVACAWYAKIAGGPTGIERVKIEKRIAQAQSDGDSAGSVVAEGSRTKAIIVKETPVYLTSLKEVSVKCLDENWNNRTLKCNGVASSHAFYLHPGSDDTSHVTYDLAGRGVSFAVMVGLNDDVDSCRTPLTFRVVGDGKLLWKSKPVQHRTDVQICRVPVAGVDYITLEVECAGRYENAHASWLDPTVSFAAIHKGMTVYLTTFKEIDPKCKRNRWKMEGLKVNDQPAKHGLYTHPETNSPAHIAYDLNGQCTTFQSVVGINDDVAGSDNPFIFKVIGDGNVLWQSKPLQHRGETDVCKVPVAGIRQLRLEVESQGSDGSAHAIWVDPAVVF